jgi:Zn-dependent protease with chaperone function
MGTKFDTTSYRYPHETLLLGVTFLVVMMVILFTAAATICGSALFVPAVVILGYIATRKTHQDLLSRGKQVTEQSSPEMLRIIQENRARLQVEPVNVFIVPSKTLNAYTFGMDSPKAVVLYASLFEIMDRDEIQFILGHELGHVKLGHTWLNTLVGGMAGIPSSLGAAAIMELAFRWWNRACEYSADRAGILACGRANKAISALVKLEAGPVALTQAGMQAALQHLSKDDDDILHNLEELIATHPITARRIDAIREYASSPDFHRLRSRMDQNLAV